jgi:DNA repair exonuclease SbcCD nuclease subunit
MKKRFLIVGDNHMDSKTPQSRLDNYMESCLMELRETLQIAKAVKADYYILLGDVFNRIEVGGECRNRALEILSSDNGTPWPFEKYVVIGNHDIAHNPSYIGKSALKTLISANVIKEGLTDEDLSISFYHFTPKLDEQLLEGVLKDDPSKMIFLHASITDKPSRFEHILFKDLQLNEKTKVVVSGHIHAPMEATREDGVKFFNPGCLGRTEVSEQHAPQVLLIQYDYDNNHIEHKHFMLKNSLKADVVFDIDKSKQKKQDSKNTEAFISAVTNISISDTTSGDMEQDFRAFAENRNVNDSVIKTVIETINIIKTGGTLQ